MVRKIAVIATEFLEEFICKTLDELNLGFTYRIFYLPLHFQGFKRNL